MRTVFFAHSGGAQAGPGQGSYDLVQELGKDLGAGYEVRFPVIENPEEPDYPQWESLFDAEFKRCPDGGILVGHSLGGSMLLKYLSEKPIRFKIGGLFAVATPWWGPSGWDVEEFRPRPDFAKHLPPIPEIRLFHSKRDPVVPFGHLALYGSALPQATLCPLPGQEHVFAQGLPALTDAITALKPR